MAWAHNNGKTLVPDGEGLLPLNYLRRSEAMISSMLRFGTGRHVMPDDMQYIGLLTREEYDQHLAMDEKSDVPEATLNLIPQAMKDKLAELRKQHWLDESTSEDVSLTYTNNLYWLMKSAANLASWRDPFINQLAVGTDGELYGPGGKKLGDPEARPAAELAARTGVGLTTRYRAGLFWSLEEAAQGGEVVDLRGLPSEPGSGGVGTSRAGLLPTSRRWSVAGEASASVLSGAMPVALRGGPAFYSPARTPDPYRGAEVRPGTTEAQRETGRAAVADLQRRFALGRKLFGNSKNRPPVSVLAAGFIDNFVAGKPNQLVGQHIHSTFDLAALAQVYRDPRFETFRIIYTQGSKVVGERGSYAPTIENW